MIADILPGKVSIQRSGRAIIGRGSIRLVGKSAQMNLPTVNDNVGSPLSARTIIRNTLCSRRVATVNSLITKILLLRSESQIRPPIVESITIDVVYPLIGTGFKDSPVEILGLSCPVGVYRCAGSVDSPIAQLHVPDGLTYVSSIARIDHGKQAPRKWNQQGGSAKVCVIGYQGRRSSSSLGWGRLIAHAMSFHRVPRTGRLPPRRCISLPQLYPIGA